MSPVLILIPKGLAEMDDLFDNRITTLFSNAHNIENAVLESDLVIGAVLVPGAKAPKLVTREMISKMEKGSVVVDIAVDQGAALRHVNQPPMRILLLKLMVWFIIVSPICRVQFLEHQHMLLPTSL
jgi:alanine dehydrogenase